MALSKIRDESTDGSVAGGKVLQVQSATKLDTFSTSSLLADIPGLSVTITPASTSSKILVMVQCMVTGLDAGLILQLVRDSTEIYKANPAGNRTIGSMIGYYSPSSPTQYGAGANHLHFLDSPNTTSSTTYKLQGGVINGSTMLVGRTTYDLDNNNASRSPSTITVMEIAG
jgi:hypothetical protein